ncbi:hypothetical protein [Rhodoblastus sp.]|jgi:hypothetical protein|uniref:hypothetical protein n=1 Tax=Rhodoblastus sp. TaxID=1962975 RepID=UPI0025DDB95A|nr:hypothetical protein [Rhodoblastus sp.]
MLTKLADKCKSLGVIGAAIIVIIVLLATMRDLFDSRQELILLTIPKQISMLGYTNNDIAKLVTLKTILTKINAERDFDLATQRYGLLPQTDIESLKIPGSEFSVRGLSNLIRDLLFLPSRRILASVTAGKDEYTYLIAAQSDFENGTAPRSDTDIDDIINNLSQSTLKIMSPYTLAASLYNDEKVINGTSFHNTLSIINYILSHAVKGSRQEYLAKNLKCIVSNDLHLYDDAVTQCTDAISIDKNDWPAHAALSEVYFFKALPRINPMTGAAPDDAKELCRKSIYEYNIAFKAHQTENIKGLRKLIDLCQKAAGD